MKEWFEKCKELSRRWRSLSIAGASVLAIIAAWDVYVLIRLIVVNETEIIYTLKILRLNDLFPALILGLLVIRLFGLISQTASSRSLASYAWLATLFLVITTFIFRAIQMSQAFEPICVSVPGQVCFGIYDISRQPLTHFASFVFVVGGIVRIITIGFIALVKRETKLA